jgi:hypothetical protein
MLHGHNCDKPSTTGKAMNAEDARYKAKQEKVESTRKLECANEIEKHKRETLNSLVREQLIGTLGKPDDLLTVQVRPLWATNFRANVFVGASIACAKISHSYFLVTDDDGNILKSTPTIKRLY